MESIKICHLPKAKVLAALYNGSKVQGLGFLHTIPGNMTEEEAFQLLENSEDKYFDYVHGRVMKVDLSGDNLMPYLYDRDNGHGEAKRIIDSI